MHLARVFGDRVDDAHIAGTPAQSRGHAGADGVRRMIIAVVHQIHRGHQHAGRTEPALQRVMFGKQFLQGVHLAVGRQPFDGADLGAVRLHRKHQAGPRRIAIDDHGARAADAMFAPHMGAGAAQLVAQEIHQQHARLGFAGQALTIDGDGYFSGIGHAAPPARRAAFSTARRVMTPAILRR